VTVTINPQAPRIFRLSIRRADGKRRWKLVKTTSTVRDLHASVYGLNAKLAELTLEGKITAGAVIVPATITDKQRDRLVRWPEALEAMLEVES
jgi:hypothetical protein